MASAVAAEVTGGCGFKPPNTCRASTKFMKPARERSRNLKGVGRQVLLAEQFEFDPAFQG